MGCNYRLIKTNLFVHSGEKGSPGEIKTSVGDPGDKGAKGLSGNPGPEGETDPPTVSSLFLKQVNKTTNSTDKIMVFHNDGSPTSNLSVCQLLYVHLFAIISSGLLYYLILRP